MAGEGWCAGGEGLWSENVQLMLGKERGVRDRVSRGMGGRVLV